MVGCERRWVITLSLKKKLHKLTASSCFYFSVCPPDAVGDDAGRQNGRLCGRHPGRISPWLPRFSPLTACLQLHGVPVPVSRCVKLWPIGAAITNLEYFYFRNDDGKSDVMIFSSGCIEPRNSVSHLCLVVIIALSP